MRIINTANLPRKGLDLNTEDWVYNGLDCCVTQEVLDATHAQLDNTSGSTYQFSLDLQAPILDMSMRGLLVDRQRKAEVIHKFESQITRIGEQLDAFVHDGIGVPINWRSPKQLRWLLYDIMNLPVQRKRNSQGRMAPTVGREAIETLEQYFIAQPICSHILALRDLGKKLGFLKTSIDSDSRIRCNFNIAGTKTGRLSSAMSDFGTGTNLQNVDRDLRSVFVADEGMKYANLDLEQADSRNVGAICWNNFASTHGEEFAGAYLAACESGDLHTTVCRMAYTNLDWDSAANPRELADKIAYRNFSHRDMAKRLGHGTNYYGTPKTMARHSKVEVSIIEEFQRNYFAAFPCIPEWHKWIKGELQELSYLITLLGRRRYFFGRHPNNDPRNTEGEKTLRDAIAYSPQSMTADEVDTGLIRLWRANRVQVLMQVHDSILFQFPEEQEDEIIPWALDLMRVEIPLVRGRAFHVPIEAKTGWNWGDHNAKSPDDNPDGLTKWRGHDPRARTVPASGKKFSLWSM